jgi:ABC-type transport system involved in multi-copper enzyme maturation permease subunit
MPIYAPGLPPRPAHGQGDPPLVVLARFDLIRILRQKPWRFFGMAFLLILVIQLTTLYFRHLLDTTAQLAAMRSATAGLLSQGARFQADLLPPWLLFLLWFQVALLCGGLVARDTLHRTRPLMYAHPVTPLDYLAAKGLVAALLPLVVLVPFVLLPWALSMAIAGASGPYWPQAPLLLLPAALAVALLMGAVALGGSSLAATPRAGFAWVLGILLGTKAVGSILAWLLENRAWEALSPGRLAEAWPQLLCGMADPRLGWGPTLAGTACHLGFWILVAARRTRPGEATL